VWPAIVILPPADAAPLAHAQAALAAYDIAIFVSANAVEFGAPPSARWPAHSVPFAPGPGTAEALAAAGIPNPHVPVDVARQRGIARAASLADVTGKRVVVFRGEGGREFLGDTLRARGATVDHVPAIAARRRDGGAGLSTRCARPSARADAHVERRPRQPARALGPTAARDRAPARVRRASAIAERAREHGLRAIETAAATRALAGLLEWFAASRTRPRASVTTPATFHRLRKAVMNDVDILVTAPLPPFLYEPLEGRLSLPRLRGGERQAGAPRAAGARVRGLVQGGGTVTPTSLLDALPKLEIISVFGVGYDGVPVDYCRSAASRSRTRPTC
jgi:uroporphyrinogen-III synthase